MLMKLVWVALGGICGASSRFLVSELMKTWLGARFPWGTLSVNMLGSFCMGLLFALAQKQLLSEPLKLLLMVGFLGSFTTFSSFALDNVNLVRQESMTSMMLHIGFQNTVGVLLAIAGIALGTRLAS